MKKLQFTFLVSATLLSCTPETGNETVTSLGEWRHAGGTHWSAKYTPLDQIDASNFNSLEVAWRWQSIDSQLPRDLAYTTGDHRAVPLVIDGVLYTNTNHGQVVALEPGTGEELWRFDPESYRSGRPNFSPLQTRGIEYWTDGEIERLFLATLGKQLVSIDIETGQPEYSTSLRQHGTGRLYHNAACGTKKPTC